MNRALALLIIGLTFGGGLGFVLAAANGVTLDNGPHADHRLTGADLAAHAKLHETPLVLAAEDAPTLQIDLLPDPVAGWNLHVMTTDFTFAPQSAGLEHVAGEGHAHVYANGTKLGRIYSDWTHLELPRGEVEVKVTLTANDHRPLSVGDTPIEAILTINTEE
ncbi:MAG: hypothetical protein AAFY39_09595 [Pseudomonadota bacterium]